MADEEQRVPPQSPDATPIAVFALAGETRNAMQYTSIVPIMVPQACIAGTGVDYVRNTHSSRSIRATVRTRWIYDHAEHESYDDYVLAPGRRAAIGCVIPGPTMQRFDHDIYAAIFLN